MKDLIIGLVVSALIAAGIILYFNGTLDAMMHPGQTKSAGTWVDNEEVAKKNGDTYCTKCKKFTPGKVRICSHCARRSSSDIAPDANEFSNPL